MVDADRQLGGRVPTDANLEFFDALVRHQTFLMRLSGSIRNEVVDLLNKTERDLAAKIRDQLRSTRGPSEAATRRINLLMSEIKDLRAAAWLDVENLWTDQFRDLTVSEAKFAKNAVETVVPVKMDTTLPSATKLKALVTTRPFEGRVLKKWAADQRIHDLNLIRDQVQIGVVQGEGSATIARRVVGSARANGTDGITQISRRNADAITRTAINSYSNAARSMFMQENSDVFSEELYVATLDSRTCWSPESLVLMANGCRKPIGDITIGEMVIGGVTGKPCRVLATYRDVVASSVAVYNGGSKIGNTTHDHKILTTEGWQKAGRICLSSDVHKWQVLRRRFIQSRAKVQGTFTQGDGRLAVGGSQGISRSWRTKDADITQGVEQASFISVGAGGNTKSPNANARRLQHDGSWHGQTGSRMEENGWRKIGCVVQEKQHIFTASRESDESTGGVDRGFDAGDDFKENNTGRKGEICRDNEESIREHINRTAERDVKKGVVRSEETQDDIRCPKEGRVVDDRKIQGHSGGQGSGDDAFEVARSGVSQAEGGCVCEAGGTPEASRERRQICCGDHAGWLEAEESGQPEIGNREMVETASIRGQVDYRETEIVSLTVDDDPTYVVGGLISHNTPICRSLDGKTFPVGEGPHPPLHHNCRSLRVAKINEDAVGRRPFKASTQKMLNREFAEQNGLSKFAKRSELPRGFKGKFDTFSRKRVRELTGSLPAKVAYPEFLKRQSVEFQNDTLGVTKAKLFRSGTSVDKFVNRAGDEIPLSLLAKTDAQAFINAGLDPAAFSR